MVTVSDAYPRTEDGALDIERWLSRINVHREPSQMRQLVGAIDLAASLPDEPRVPEGENVLEHGLAMAEILATLQMDTPTLTAAIVFPSVEYGHLALDRVQHKLGKEVKRLVEGTQRMQAIRALQTDHQSHILSAEEVENLRKMLLAMVDDTRVVMIKLARRLQMLRLCKYLDEATARSIAQETMDIYAPLANRLGIGQIKWELEDLAFRQLNPEAYRDIAKKLAARRIDRERYINQVIAILKREIDKYGIQAEIAGRAKHIYSIWRKMQRKGVSFEEIYDARAVRVLVPKIADCYTVLGIVHTLWPHIPKEFDDYIATPKPNGYRSIHTAVIGPEQKALEVQIRTFRMHQESEHGVAAHWRYKEGKSSRGDDAAERKVAWLRQLLAWQKELASTDQIMRQFEQSVEDERVFVFTPEGRVLDLPPGSTPLDFAYHVHTEIGHHCVGAKVNGRMVPLTTPLSTGQTVEILTRKEAKPSRDWLNPSAGYLRSHRARQKVAQWFRRQEKTAYIARGREMLERAMTNRGLSGVSLQGVAEKLNLKHVDDLYAAIGIGDLGVEQVTNTMLRMFPELAPKHEETLRLSSRTSQAASAQSAVIVEGLGNVLTHIAGCCHPVPGEPIVGYITQGRGVTVHASQCPHIRRARQQNPNRLIGVQWQSGAGGRFVVNLLLEVVDRTGILRDLTHLLAQAKIPIVAMNSQISRKHEHALIELQIEVLDQQQLDDVMARIQGMRDVLSVRRG